MDNERLIENGEVVEVPVQESSRTDCADTGAPQRIIRFGIPYVQALDSDGRRECDVDCADATKCELVSDNVQGDRIEMENFPKSI